MFNTPRDNGQSLLQSQAYNFVKQQILTNKLDTEILHSETKLAAELGISRTPLRQALHRLSQDGYITIYPSKGFMIRHLTEKDMIQTIQVRCAIEGFCTHIIANEQDAKKRDKFFSQMEDLIKSMRNARRMDDNYETFMEYDHNFHLLIVKFVDNEEFLQIFQRLMYLIHLTSKTSLSIPGRVDSTMDEHEIYLKHLKKRDGALAYNIMLEHLMMPIKLLNKHE